VEYPLWSASDEDLFVEACGPGTRVSVSSWDPSAPRISTIAIDEVHDQSLERVDLIKMDIEGAEPYALRGAEKTLKKFPPKLGIAVYHRIEDFLNDSSISHALDLGYRFYLRHFTIHSEEAILFARTE
jgi:hypothetical protein